MEPASCPTGGGLPLGCCDGAWPGLVWSGLIWLCGMLFHHTWAVLSRACPCCRCIWVNRHTSRFNCRAYYHFIFTKRVDAAGGALHASSCSFFRQHLDVLITVNYNSNNLGVANARASFSASFLVDMLITLAMLRKGKLHFQQGLPPESTYNRTIQRLGFVCYSSH